MIKQQSDASFDAFHARCESFVRQFAPIQVDEWLDEAQTYIRNTAEALHTVKATSISGTTEPAFCFAVGTILDHAPRSVNKAHASDSIDGTWQSPTLGFTIVEWADALRRGDMSPVDLVKTCLARIKASDGAVKAWDTIAREKALAQARHAERALREGRHLGPLHGIPFGIKDNIFTEGIRTAGGSRLHEHFVPSYDANVATVLKKAGAIVLGKTTTAELALGDPPATCNPWNLAHTPGGSSSGSAAAVAAGHVPFTVGTQTGGSLNRPAGYCGLVALKPTFGRMDRHGIFPVSWTMDHVGFMTRTAVDQAVIYRSLVAGNSDPTGRESTRFPLHNLKDVSNTIGSEPLGSNPLKGLTIGRPDRFFIDGLHPDQHAAYDKLLQVLERDLGATVKDVVLPTLCDAAVAAHTIIMQCEAAASYADALRQEDGGAYRSVFRPAFRSRLLCGIATSATEYIRAQQIRNLYIQHLTSLFRDEGIDVLATPTSPTPAPKGIHWTGSSMFNSPFSLSGFPTIVFPTGFEKETNLPLSAQFVALPWQENALLDVAIAYQTVTDWHTRHATSHLY